MTDFQSDVPRVGMPTHVREILRRARRPMSLGAILEALAEVMPLDECSDPLHYLRGVTTKGVKDGWLERPDRGKYQLAEAARGRNGINAKANGSSNGSKRSKTTSVRAQAPQVTQRRTKKSLEITVGEITLRTPSGMQPDVLARIVQAIRGTYAN